MAIGDIYGLFFPPAITGHAGAPSYSSFVTDASGEKFAYILQAPKTGFIRKIHFRTGTVTTPTDTDVRVETVDGATGMPSGALFGATTNVTVASGSITSNAWITSGALTADASVTVGDTLAIAFVPTGSPNFNFNYYAITNDATRRFPFTVLGPGGAYSGTTSGSPVVAIEYSDGSFAYTPGTFPYIAINTHTFNNTSTPDEYALKFSMAAPIRVAGAWIHVDLDGDADIVLYDSDGATALVTKSLDKDARASTSSGMVQVLFPGSVSLSANTYYRLAVKPTSATSLSIYSNDVSTAAILDCVEGGQNFHHSTRADAGAWTDVTTRRLMLGLIIDGIDAGVSAGGAAQFRMGSVG